MAYLNGRTMALLWNISWMGAIICAFRVCGRSDTNQSVENWLGKCYWLDFNYCVQCVVVLTSFLSVGRNPKMPYFWLNVRSECVQFWSFKLKSANSKGQIKPNQFGRTVDFPKKWTNKFVLFVGKSKKANKTNSFVGFWENLQRINLLYLTFNSSFKHL